MVDNEQQGMRDMMMKKLAQLGIVGVLAVCATPAIAQESEPYNGDVFYGGTIGLGFGDVNYFELAPLVGKHLTPQFSFGGSLIYRYRSDDRYQQDLTTNDYGASVFGRFKVTPQVFAQAEYEYLQYEYYKPNLTKDTDSANSVFLGGGVSAPAGANASLYATAMYNVNYDDDSPYDSPWVIRFGVGVGF
jgi:hypothetical protein